MRTAKKDKNDEIRLESEDMFSDCGVQIQDKLPGYDFVYT